MNLLQEINKQLHQDDEVTEQIVELTDELLEADEETARLGLSEEGTLNFDDNRPEEKTGISQGDIVLNVGRGQVQPLVITKANGTRPVARSPKTGEEMPLEKEFLVIGAQARSRPVRAAAQKLAMKHPTRRIWVYGDTAKQEF